MKLKLVLLLFVFTQLTQVIAQNKNLQKLGNLTYSKELSDVWGYVGANGKEYALVGVYNGFSIVDVSNPANPIERQFIPGVNSIWRDIKTWGHYAYVTNEGGGSLLIVNLLGLETNSTCSFQNKFFAVNTFNTAHNIYIDEKGYAYIFGADQGVGGALILDLNNDPYNPEMINIIDNEYLHDGVVRGDTLWGAAINIGKIVVYDLTDRTNPVQMTNFYTPGFFAHNCWISDDNKYLYTTDEISDGALGAYDVSDLNNVSFLTTNQSNPGSLVIPHNTHFINEYLVTSYYRDGLTIVDVSRPNNIVQTGNYDTSPQNSGDGFNGAWGAYPWLPSGNILVTDIENGLFILKPTYKRGCYLEGVVSEQYTGQLIQGATITISSGKQSDSNLLGTYRMAQADSGTYTVTISHPNYPSKTFQNVVLQNGTVTQLNVQLTNAPASISEIENAENVFSFWPTTTASFITIETEIGASISIVAMDGKVMQNLVVTTTNQQVNCEQLPAGFYMIKCSTITGKEQVKKLIKQ